MRAPRLLTRRRFLLETGTAIAAAACAGQPGGGGGPDAGSRSLVFANWPAYIDQPGRFATSSLEDFRAETGIQVDYQEVIDDNDSFLARIEPALRAGAATGFDLAVLTDFAVARLIREGWLEPLEHAGAQVIPSLASPAFDAARAYSLPWQAGLTGIAYDITRTGRELTSVNDIFDPAFAGRAELLHELRDTLGLVMLGQGVDPSRATRADALAAIERLRPAVTSGQISGFSGSSEVAAGEAALAFAWSGDVRYLVQENPNLRFFLPPEGGMLWADNLIIPKGAASRREAEELARFVYRPAIAAKIESWVGYLCPVEGARAAMRELAASTEDPELAAMADDPLLFPDADTLSRAHVFATLDEADEAAISAAFLELTGP